MKALVVLRRALLVLILVLVALTLAGQSAFAASHGSHGGGNHGGGGYHGGGGGGHDHAVPRGSVGYGSAYHGGHYSQGYGYGHYGYGHSHAYYGHGYYGGYYRGYYPYPYYYGYYGAPYYWGWPAISVGIGYSSYPSYPSYPTYGPAYAAANDAPAETYSARPQAAVEYAAPATRTIDDSSADSGRVRLAVTPGDASVYVDDEFWGHAGRTGALILRAGPHSIEVVRPGFAAVRRELTIPRGETLDMRVDLQRQ